MKSERLKKLEAELKDLEQWQKLGLVPKKDEAKHKAEIQGIAAKIEEERDRLQFLKDNDSDEYVAPKRAPGRSAYQTEIPSIPDIEFGDNNATEGFQETEESQNNTESDTESDDEEEETELEETQADKAPQDEEEADDDDEEEAESFFSERRSRWRGEGIMDPEADDW